MLIPTYYLLSKNWDIFATRYCILLIFNPNYFRGSEVITFLDKKNPCSRLATRIFCLITNHCPAKRSQRNPHPEHRTLALAFRYHTNVAMTRIGEGLTD